MADLSITISNTLKVRNAVVEDAYSLWGTFVWGTNRWFGEFDTAWDMDQWIANGIALSQTLGKNVVKGIPNAMSLSDLTYRNLSKTFAHGIAFSTTITATAMQGDWSRQARDSEIWTEQDPDTESWTEASSASTDWS